MTTFKPLTPEFEEKMREIIAFPHGARVTTSTQMEADVAEYLAERCGRTDLTVRVEDQPGAYRIDCVRGFIKNLMRHQFGNEAVSTEPDPVLAGSPVSL